MFTHDVSLTEYFLNDKKLKQCLGFRYLPISTQESVCPPCEHNCVLHCASTYMQNLTNEGIHHWNICVYLNTSESSDVDNFSHIHDTKISQSIIVLLCVCVRMLCSRVPAIIRLIPKVLSCFTVIVRVFVYFVNFMMGFDVSAAESGISVKKSDEFAKRRNVLKKFEL